MLAQQKTTIIYLLLFPVIKDLHGPSGVIKGRWASCRLSPGFVQIRQLTVGVGFLVSVSCIDETGGAVVFVLQLHMETRRLAKRAAGR